MGAVLAASVGLAVAQQQPAVSPAAAPPAAAEPPTVATPRRIVVRFVTEADFPPFNFMDEDGQLVGFNVDLARAICVELAVACDLKVRPWEELFLALKRGEADAVVAAHRVSAKALEEIEFTDRYFATPGRFAQRRGADAAEEISPNALDGKKIGVARGSPHEAYMRAFFRDSATTPFENADLAREALIQGKVDLLFDDGISLAFWVNGTVSKQCCELAGGAYMEPKYFGDGLAIAVARTDFEMRSLINGALKRVRASGRFEELIQRYFPVRAY